MNDCQRCRQHAALWDKISWLMEIVAVRLCQYCLTEFDKAVKHMEGYALVKAARINGITLKGRIEAGDAPTKQEWEAHWEMELRGFEAMRPHIEAWACHQRTEAYQEPVRSE